MRCLWTDEDVLGLLTPGLLLNASEPQAQNKGPFTKLLPYLETPSIKSGTSNNP